MKRRLKRREKPGEDLLCMVLRGVRADTEHLGIQFKQNDKLFFMTQVYGMDERRVDDPLRVDFSRPVSPHLGFGAGPHRCIGSHLARTEVRIFLEEWTRRIPTFGITGDGEIRTRGGHVWSPIALPLAWAVIVCGSGPFARGQSVGPRRAKEKSVPSLRAYAASRFTSSSAASRAIMPTRTPQARASWLAALMMPSS